MASGGEGSRKRPPEEDAVADGGGGRAARARDAKRRQIQQASWGFREVLAECGLAEFAGGGGESVSVRPGPAPRTRGQRGQRKLIGRSLVAEPSLLPLFLKWHAVSLGRMQRIVTKYAI